MNHINEQISQLKQYGIAIDVDQYHLNKTKKVVVGMSGGVDSSVAALLLKLQGYEVIGIFMKNWEEQDENGVCTSDQDYADVVKVCEKIDIPYYSFNFSSEYRELVFRQFLADYRNGYTPNPDIFCNKEIKFRVFYDACLKLGADYLATGHYCQVKLDGDHAMLLKGADPSKDQSYFLNAIDGDVLLKVLFPIGELLKKTVRKIAQDFDLPTKNKKDSTGVCFIGERDFKLFLKQYIESQRGEFKTLSGQVVGEHDGSCFYTLGQRKGLGLGGAGQPWFVVAKDHQNNIVYVERGDDHPALYHQKLIASDAYWINKPSKENDQLICRAKIRYRQHDQDCEVEFKEGLLEVNFKQPQRAITPGQYIVFYQNNICLGGAVIKSMTH